MPRIQTDAASNHTMNIKKKAMDPDVDQGPSRLIKPIPAGDAVNAGGIIKEEALELVLKCDYDLDEDIARPAVKPVDETQNVHIEIVNSHVEKRKVGKRPKSDICVFLELEAAVEGGSDESDDGTEDSFIDDKDEIHARPGMQLLADTMENRTEPFQRRLSKYVGRTSTQTLPTGTSPLHSEWPTWEVPVTVGLEAVAVFRILQKCEAGFCVDHNAPRSAFFNPCLPGRIFVEVLRHDDAKFVCTGIPGVRTNRITAVEHGAARDYLDRSSFSFSQTIMAGCWVRLTRSYYKHDLALVVDKDTRANTVDVVVVPRVSYSKDPLGKRKRGGRPEQALFDPEKCQEIFGQKSIEVITAHAGIPGHDADEVVGYIFCSQRYDRRGYLLLKDLPHGHYKPVDEASRVEYMLFSNCGAVSTSVLSSSIKTLANRSLKRSEKVQILDGTFQGHIGTVEDVHPHYVEINLPVTVFHGLLELPLLSVCRTFVVGDRVLVNSGDRRGTQGFVTSMDVRLQSVTIQSIMPQVFEIETSVDNVQIMPHDQACVIPKPKPARLPNWRDANLQQYVHAQVVMKSHPFKGYTGVIRSINGDAIADIELHIFSVGGIQMTQRHILDLYFILEEDKRLYETQNEETYDLTVTNIVVQPHKPPTPPPRSQTPEPVFNPLECDPAWTPQEGEGEREPAPPTVLPFIPKCH